MKAHSIVKRPSIGFLSSVTIALGLSAQLPLGAALFYYDGFAAGGTSPDPDEYQTSPASTNGIDNNSLVRAVTAPPTGQDPETFGFAAPGWRTNDAVSSGVYGRATDTALSYTGMPTVAGSASIFRTGTNTDGPQTKSYFRSLEGTPGVGESALYFSSLLRFTAGTQGNFALRQTTKILSIGFDTAGRVALNHTDGVTGGTSALMYAANTTYLLVAKVYSTNLVDVWLNPTDLSSEGGSSGQLVISGATLGAGGFAAGVALTDFRLSANTGNSVTNPDFMLDEVRGASTWGEALTAIPEPSGVALGFFAGLVFLLRRRR